MLFSAKIGMNSVTRPKTGNNNMNRMINDR